LETKSNKVLIIGDKAGAAKIDFSKGIEDDWFKHFDDYDIEQQFKRYECST
jgi:hypothetical protein